MLALVLDDAEMNNLVMAASLRPLAGCVPHDFTVPAEALTFAEARASEIGVVITDYEMPGMNGIEFIRAVRRVAGLAHVPIVMVTSHDQRSLRREALEAGATDFLTKPADAVEIRARVTNLLALSAAHRAQRDHAAQLAREVAAAVALVEEREREIVSTLMRAAEHRDSDTGDHIARVSAYVGLIAEAMGTSPAERRDLVLAATMHDVGKIAVPDYILLKPGLLTPEERRTMETHAERGRRILGGSASSVMRLAAEIAVSHHERWDGGGYPHRLSGTAIPLPGRIVAVADVFDALTTKRPYKEAWSPERARQHLIEKAGTHFDPAVVTAFLSRWSEIEAMLHPQRGGLAVPVAAEGWAIAPRRNADPSATRHPTWKNEWSHAYADAGPAGGLTPRCIVCRDYLHRAGLGAQFDASGLHSDRLGMEWMRTCALGHLKAFRSDRRGGVALIFGLSATVLVGLVGGGIDYARLSARRSQLQAAVDAGVLAGGNALKLAASSTDSVRGVTEQTIRDAAKSPPDRALGLRIEVPAEKTSVFARAEETVRLAFGGLVGFGTQTIVAQARVNVVGKMRLCMLTLDPSAMGAFNLQKNAQVTANACSLYSNSANVSGMVGGDNAMARADTICSAGGYLGLRANFAPPPQTGCPVIEDPLKDRPAPTIGECVTLPSTAKKPPKQKPNTPTNEIDQSVTLEPGTYCGGLHITKNAVVTLRGGIYVMKDGPLVVDKDATMKGTDVAFYFAGDNGGLVFDKKTTISLTAPTTGVMAGLLMMEERTVGTPLDPTDVVEVDYGDTIAPTPSPLGQTKPMRTYRIISDNARTMLGTIYLPAGRVVIDAKRPVADQSAYTVVVAQQVNLYEGPNLYLNANYDQTSVPVPKGVGPISGKLLLTQ